MSNMYLLNNNFTHISYFLFINYVYSPFGPENERLKELTYMLSQRLFTELYQTFYVFTSVGT